MKSYETFEEYAKAYKNAEEMYAEYEIQELIVNKNIDYLTFEEFLIKNNIEL